MEKEIIKNKYNFMELVKKELKNRGIYKYSKEVINYAFENRFTETWHSMFRYETEKPTEKDKMLGNFYIECDVEDFNINKNIILTAVEYLHNKYDIPYSYFNFFITSRSIWCYIPYKVFGIYPQINLNKIYKQMAEEINQYILKEGYSNGLDLSIYKWNGLIHSLGSYLPKSKRWVNKFTYWDLLYSNNNEDLIMSKWDYGFTFEDIKPVNKCKIWVNSLKKKNRNKLQATYSLIKGY